MTGHPDWVYDEEPWPVDDPLTGCLRVLGGVALVAGLAFLALFVAAVAVG